MTNRLMPEISVLRGGGVRVNTLDNYSVGGNEVVLTFLARPMSEGELRCVVRHGGFSDVFLLPQEARLIADQLRVLADCIEAEETQRVADARKNEALRRLKDAR